MTTISSIDTSFYPGLVEGFAPTTTLPVPSVEAEPQDNSGNYSGEYRQEQNESVDLSNYYNEVRPEDLLTKTGQQVVEAAQVLDNTMVTALHNGYSVQDVCNIKLAEQAYKASAYVFKVANEMSTFTLKI